MAGYVDADGHAQLTTKSAPLELWGFDQEKSPALLFRAKGDKLTPMRQPMPLSPLFTIGKMRPDLLASAKVDPGDKLFSGHLPPLFADLAEKK